VHGISYIVGVRAGLYIVVLASMVGGEDYYCRKLFHTPILQQIVNVKCRYWDYKFHSAGSL